MKKTGIIPLVLTIAIAGVFAFGICASCFLTNSEEDTVTTKNDTACITNSPVLSHGPGYSN